MLCFLRKLKWIFSAVLIIHFTFSCTIQATHESYELILVQMLYRHGDRAPIYLYPRDPNPEDVWPDGLGKLTQLGRQQHHNLGKFFNAFYKNFMNSDPSEISVMSTDSERCIESAKANLASFYPSFEAVEYLKQTSDLQIPIVFVPGSYDQYLGINVYCPKYFAEERRILDNEGAVFSAKYREMLDYYSNHSGKPIKNWKSAFMLYDTLFIEKKYNHIVPKWAYAYWSQLEEIADSAYHRLNTDIIRRLRAGPLIKLLIKTMKSKSEKDASTLKFRVFSAHDSNIAYVSNALHLNIRKRAPYCATLIFELYRGQMNSHFVRILYLNSTEPEKAIESPHVLVLDDCEEFCPLEYFIEYTRHLIPIDFWDECMTPESSRGDSSQGVPLAVVKVVVAFIILAMIFSRFRRFCARRKNLLKYASFHLKL